MTLPYLENIELTGNLLIVTEHSPEFEEMWFAQINEPVYWCGDTLCIVEHRGGNIVGVSQQLLENVRYFNVLRPTANRCYQLGPYALTPLGWFGVNPNKVIVFEVGEKGGNHD
jgi:hypothetical protein